MLESIFILPSIQIGFLEETHVYTENHVPSAAKYSLPPKVADFAIRMSCVIKLYAMLTPVTPISQIKDLPFIIGCEPMRNVKKLFKQNLTTFG